MPQREGDRFVLFQNDKGENDKRPDFRGFVVIGGVEYEAAGWKKKDKNGNPMLSGSIQPKRERDGGGGGRRPADDDDGNW